MNIITQLSKDYNPTVTIPSEATNIHIGIEHLYSHSITDTWFQEDMFKIFINNMPYYINKYNILEFDELQNIGNMTITCANNNNWDNNTYVTIAYDDMT